jgi:hypothetical protein
MYLCVMVSIVPFFVVVILIFDFEMVHTLRSCLFFNLFYVLTTV